mmetsp:Transcript_30681/g.49247  ORF Transcript_30681/g.49247 Transcript_30681/m.49247 type:complete len:239 (-) Transcript_30681:7-723(-)
MGRNNMKIRYFFDVISPYSCLSWKVLRRYRSIWNMDVELVPVFLGGVMKATGNQPPAMLPARAVMVANDLNRSSLLYNVPLLGTPTNFFSGAARNVIHCQRLLVAAQLRNIGGDKVERLVDALTDAIHINESFRSDGNNLDINENFLERCCASAGFDSELTATLLSDRNTPDVKSGLIANTEGACEAGMYGSPTMLVYGGKGDFSEPFLVFGSDRFEQIAFLCEKPWYGPDPSRKSKL